VLPTASEPQGRGFPFRDGGREAASQRWAGCEEAAGAAPAGANRGLTSCAIPGQDVLSSAALRSVTACLTRIVPEKPTCSKRLGGEI